MPRPENTGLPGLPAACENALAASHEPHKAVASCGLCDWTPALYGDIKRNASCLLVAAPQPPARPATPSDSYSHLGRILQESFTGKLLLFIAFGAKSLTSPKADYYTVLSLRLRSACGASYIRGWAGRFLSYRNCRSQHLHNGAQHGRAGFHSEPHVLRGLDVMALLKVQCASQIAKLCPYHLSAVHTVQPTQPRSAGGLGTVLDVTSAYGPSAASSHSIIMSLDEVLLL